MQNKHLQNKNNQNETILYDSYPYPTTHPDNLYIAGKLLGITPENYKTCRLLEIGCSSGGNIIPMALKHPESTIIGVDISKDDIDYGIKQISQLKLNNITLKQACISDIDQNYGKFDYIIIHGVFSWVSLELQNKLLEVCSQNLEKNGIALISYNCLPGWNNLQTIRDVINYHTKSFSDNHTKAQQSRAILEFICQSNQTPQDPYYQIISKEADFINDLPDSYIINEYLGEYNTAFYFKDFMDKAHKHNLQYLAETDLSSMFIGNYNDYTQATLLKMGRDIIKTEQYMDFIKNRRFRLTMLCHGNLEINRNINYNVLEDFYVQSKLHSNVDLTNIDPNITKNVTFYISNKEVFSSSDPLILKMMQLLSGNKTISFNKLVTKISNSFTKYTTQEISDIILQNSLHLVLAGGLKLFTTNTLIEETAKFISDKPKAFDYARLQCQNGQNWITNLESEKLYIGAFERILLTFLNGKNSRKDLTKLISKYLKENLNSLDQLEEIPTDQDEIEKAITFSLKKMLENFVLVK